MEKQSGLQPNAQSAVCAEVSADNANSANSADNSGNANSANKKNSEREHAPLWSGRFVDRLDDDAVRFETSIQDDMRMAQDDIRGSIAHAAMLSHNGIISQEDAAAIDRGLKAIQGDLERGALKVDEDAEDIHSFIEATLTDRIGEAGRRVHTGRSRNDQVALDERLYLRRALAQLQKGLLNTVDTLTAIAEKHTDTLISGYTHLQRAQPVTLAYHLVAWACSFVRDSGRISDAAKRMNECPIGACALAGSSLPLDRKEEAALLGFNSVTMNSMDTVSDRDYCLETASALAMIQMHLSRCCEELVLWSTTEWGFVEMSEKWSTGSSIMPQKKNSDFAELIRGRTGRVYGDMIALFTMMKGLPYSYDRDLQEDKHSLFDALDTVTSCLAVFSSMVASAKWNTARMKDSLDGGYMNATDLADYLVRKGMPFREAHGVAARAVRAAIDKKARLEDLSMEDFRQLSSLIEEDVYSILPAASCVAARKTLGGPAPERVREQIEAIKKWIAKAAVPQ